MLATNHAVSGAILGALLPLEIALPLAFASHFVLDSIPHYGIKQAERNISLTYKLIVFSDTFVALSMALMLTILHKWSMEAAGWVAWSPDFLWVWYYLAHGRSLRIKPKNTFMRFHQNIQLERPWGIVTDLGSAAVMIPIFISQALK